MRTQIVSGQKRLLSSRLSGAAVLKCVSQWDEALTLAERVDDVKTWLPSHVVEALAPYIGRTETRLIEAYVDGTEFSIDGWIDEDSFQAIVQHKLYTIRSSFVGDGPTISPPLKQTDTSRVPGFADM
jgi:hypothetical protein